MKLIKRLGCLGTHYSFGLFLCPICLQEVIKLLQHGKVDKSCGCDRGQKQNQNRYKHGESKTKLYFVWLQMKQRCCNLKDFNFKNYGGRGITVCNEWTESYIVFRDWSLNNGYAEGLQINRIENDGNYEPSNCNFVTAKENCNNRRKPIKKINKKGDKNEKINT